MMPPSVRASQLDTPTAPTETWSSREPRSAIHNRDFGLLDFRALLPIPRVSPLGISPPTNQKRFYPVSLPSGATTDPSSSISVSLS